MRRTSYDEREFIECSQTGEQDGIDPPSDQPVASEPKRQPCQTADEEKEKYFFSRNPDGMGARFVCRSVLRGA